VFVEPTDEQIDFMRGSQTARDILANNNTIAGVCHGD
jgi:hypothetical protein